MIGFLVGAGLSIASNLQKNQQIEDTASANYANAVAMAERDATLQRGQLMRQSFEQSIAVNQERYNLQREAMRERSAESVSTAEGGFSGVLAQRIKTATDLSEQEQEGIININQDLQDSATQGSNSAITTGKSDRLHNARLARHNALAGKTSGLGLVTGAVSGGVAGQEVAGSLGLGGGVNAVNTAGVASTTGVLASDANPIGLSQNNGAFVPFNTSFRTAGSL
jgi:hypothetical protein